MKVVNISDDEYEKFKELIFLEIGITLNEHKKSLIESRFFKKILDLKLNSFSEYYDVCASNHREKIQMIDLITTNETYFFRENNHFEFLKEYLIEYKSSRKIRIWSAASSVGAEAYTIAMVCDSILPSNMWEVVGSDINNNVIKKARMGLYPLSWSDKISQEFKHKYCLKGKGKYDGEFLMSRQLAKNVRFLNSNLLEQDESFGYFNIVFLRNVLIYFNDEVRKKVIINILKNMNKGSLLIISKTENLNTLGIDNLEQIQPSIYKVI